MESATALIPDVQDERYINYFMYSRINNILFEINQDFLDSIRYFDDLFYSKLGEGSLLAEVKQNYLGPLLDSKTKGSLFAKILLCKTVEDLNKALSQADYFVLKDESFKFIQYHERKLLNYLSGNRIVSNDTRKILKLSIKQFFDNLYKSLFVQLETKIEGLTLIKEIEGYMNSKGRGQLYLLRIKAKTPTHADFDKTLVEEMTSFLSTNFNGGKGFLDGGFLDKDFCFEDWYFSNSKIVEVFLALSKDERIRSKALRARLLAYSNKYESRLSDYYHKISQESFKDEAEEKTKAKSVSNIKIKEKVVPYLLNQLLN